jgi:hypothetical protein
MITSEAYMYLLKVGRYEFLTDLTLVLNLQNVAYTLTDFSDFTKIPVHVAAILSQNLQNIDPDFKCNNTTNIW